MWLIWMLRLHTSGTRYDRSYPARPVAYPAPRCRSRLFRRGRSRT